jgi:hypothetical protein
MCYGDVLRVPLFDAGYISQESVPFGLAWPVLDADDPGRGRWAGKDLHDPANE